MVYEIAFMHIDGQCYAELTHDIPIYSKFARELKLENIANGKECLIWKPLTEQYYAMIVKRAFYDTPQDSRIFPVVYAVVMDKKEAVKLLHNSQNFLKVKQIEDTLPYYTIRNLTERPVSYDSVEKFLKAMHSEQKNPEMQAADGIKDGVKKVLFKCMLSALYENRSVYIRQRIILADFLNVLQHTPQCISEQISFSFPFGESPAGECMLNFLDGRDYDYKTAQNGSRIVERISELDIKNNVVLEAAQEMCRLSNNKNYMNEVKGMAFSKLKTTLQRVAKLRKINQAALCGDSIKENADFLQEISADRKFFSKFKPYIKYEGEIAEEVKERILHPEDFMKHTLVKNQGKSNSLAVYHKNSRGRYIQTCLLNAMIFVLAALLTDMIRMHYFSFNDARIIRIVLLASPENICCFLFAAVMFVTLKNLVTEIWRFCRHVICNLKCSVHHSSRKNKSERI